MAQTRGPKPKRLGRFAGDEPYLAAMYEIVTAVPRTLPYSAALAVIDERTPGHTTKHGKAVRLRGKFPKYRHARDQQRPRAAAVQRPPTEGNFRVAPLVMISHEAAAAMAKFRAAQAALVPPETAAVLAKLRGAQAALVPPETAAVLAKLRANSLSAKQRWTGFETRCQKLRLRLPDDDTK